MAIGKRLGKVSVVAGNCPGFIGNRMIGGYGRQASLMILEGAMPAQVDKLLYDFGLAMGPFAMADMVGLDLGWRARNMAGGSNDITTRIADQLCEPDRFGQKNGKGYYRYECYEEGDRPPRPHPEADEVSRKIDSQSLNVFPSVTRFRSINIIWARHGHKINPYAAVNNGCEYDCHLLKAKHLYRVHLPSVARHELPCLQSLQD
jgi:3-hydroxyacyl-CoA dehydrogenase